jgi:hypothetical protein
MTLPNGIPYYTLLDEASGAVISDSMKITEYLDAQYPEKLLVIPGASSLYKALDTAILVALGSPGRAVLKHNIGSIHPELMSDNAKHSFEMTRESYFEPIEALVCKSEVLEKMLGEVGTAMGRSHGGQLLDSTRMKVRSLSMRTGL